jgi:carboxypeptidase PM20D1
MIKRFFLILISLILILVTLILIRTFTFSAKQVKVTSAVMPVIAQRAVINLSVAIRNPTISHSDPALFDSASFIRFREFLENAYPLVHRNLKREIVSGYSLLYTWQGKDSTHRPYILMAHQDVVPVEEASKRMWTVDPFGGVVKDDFIWGRGSADDKINLIGIMESAEKLLSENFQPQRTTYFAFGHDEEVSGSGAAAIARLLKERNVKADLVLDEGGIITREKIPGMKKPVALLGTSEKGWLSIDMRVEKAGGHSSMPESETAIDILAKAITRLRENKFQARFSPSTEGFIDYVGPEMPFIQKMAFANLWLFRPMVNSIYEQTPGGNAMIRTTLVPTIVHSGIKDNVVPSVAMATLNLRTLPGDSVHRVVEKVREIVDDPRIQLTLQEGYREASGVTRTESFAYEKVQSVIRSTSDSIIATPFMMIGATDSRHYGEVSNGIIKFSPMFDPVGFHGIDERVSLESFRTTLAFYERLIRDE